MFARVASALCKTVKSGRESVCIRQLSLTAAINAREMEVRKWTWNESMKTVIIFPIDLPFREPSLDYRVKQNSFLLAGTEGQGG